MSSIKAIVLLCITGAIAVSICSAEVPKSQSSSSNSDAKQASARSYIGGGASGQGVDPNSYMNQVFQHKPVELIHLVPILLILAFIPLVLPLIFQLFAGIMTPFNFSHGRRRRDTNFHKNPEISQLLLDLAKKVGDSLEKFNEFSK